jgi:hypothetical protein
VYGAHPLKIGPRRAYQERQRARICLCMAAYPKPCMHECKETGTYVLATGPAPMGRTTTSTPPLRDLVRRRPRLRRLSYNRRRARRGIDHSGQADLDCERRFYTDAGLLKLLSRDIPLVHPDEAVKVVKKS